MCYVGKATKIFIVMVAVLLVAGLVLMLCIRRNGLLQAHPAESDDKGGSCGATRPIYPEPRSASPGIGVPPPPLSSVGTAVPPAGGPEAVSAAGAGSTQPRRYLFVLS